MTKVSFLTALRKCLRSFFELNKMHVMKREFIDILKIKSVNIKKGTKIQLSDTRLTLRKMKNNRHLYQSKMLEFCFFV